jgi:hypothetical protein
MANLSEVFLAEPGKAKTIRLKAEGDKETQQSLKAGDELPLKLRTRILGGREEIKILTAEGKTVGTITGELLEQLKPHLHEIKAYFISGKRGFVRILLKCEHSIFPEEKENKVEPSVVLPHPQPPLSSEL